MLALTVAWGERPAFVYPNRWIAERRERVSGSDTMHERVALVSFAAFWVPRLRSPRMRCYYYRTLWLFIAYKSRKRLFGPPISGVGRFPGTPRRVDGLERG